MATRRGNGNGRSAGGEQSPKAQIEIQARRDGSVELATGPAFGGKVIGQRVSLMGNRDAGTSVTVAADAVVRVELGDGLCLWMRCDDLIAEYGEQLPTREAATNAYRIHAVPPAVAAQQTSRGLSGAVITALEFFDISPAAAVATTLAAKFESHVLGVPPGLHAVDLASGALTEASGLDAQAPILLFLHGTASSFAGSFGGLFLSHADEGANRAAAALRTALADRYAGRAFALQHRSLTESPIANLQQLVEHLPEDAELHVVSHSRGGLIGELLALAELEDATTLDLSEMFKGDAIQERQLGLAAFSTEQRHERRRTLDAERSALAGALAELRAKRVRVTRFVRVACPALGTTLASGRLDRWLSILNALVPSGASAVTDFLLAVVKQRTDPRTLPGLEAMMPGSAVTTLLANPRLRTQADLTAIAGCHEGGGLFGRLLAWTSNWFFGSEHDLVVNTGSMFGGLQRGAARARYGLDRGTAVHHFNYFSNATSIEWLQRGLLRRNGEQAGFQPIVTPLVTTPRWRSAVARSAVGGPRPIAVVIPGTLGSSLSASGDLVWLHYRRLAFGGFARLAWQKEKVVPGEPIADFYGPLLEHLATTHHVAPFAYDWRDSLLAAAARLVEHLQPLVAQAERTQQSVHVVAHSLGGLVVRAMIGDQIGGGANLWARIAVLPGSRLLMLGTPNHGSYEAVRWLTGHNPTQNQIALLDQSRTVRDLIAIVREFPGLAELLPVGPDEKAWHDPETWRELKASLGASWQPASAEVLAQAAATWARLRDCPVDPPRMIYVAGCQPQTVIGHVAYETWFGARRARYLATSEGDGTVTWQSGQLPGVPTFYVKDTAHDELCCPDDREVLRAYLELLQQGKTSRLPTTPPMSRGPRTFAVTPAAIDSLPQEADLRGFGFGGTRRKLPRRPPDARHTPLRVSVRHGDLAYATHPVLVGHYAGDTIVSAEAVLDQQMREGEGPGPLSQRRDLGMYPGPLGSHAVFFNKRDGAHPGGALVVGLGNVGDLSPATLEAGVRDVLLDYTLQRLQRSSSNPPARGSCGVTALLIGTTAGGFSVRDAISAILRGALAANDRLRQAKLATDGCICELEFLELYEDVAVAAAHELRRLLDVPDLRERVEWPEQVVTQGVGGRRRIRLSGDPEWWPRLEVSVDRKAETLRFVHFGDRARAEQTVAFGNLRNAEALIAAACENVTYDPEVGKTLFEMLVPQTLKERAPDQRHTVFLVDEVSAALPLELLEDRWSNRSAPRATEFGMIRQLKVATYRSSPALQSKNTALVIGDPDLADAKDFAQLPGARQEAEAVAKVLGEARSPQANGAGFAVTALIHTGPDEVWNALHRDGWRVLHLAGHGVHDYEVSFAPRTGDETIELSDGSLCKRLPTTKRVSGMVLDKQTVLTAGDIQQMRWVPELVFVNCCHLGKTGAGSHRFHQLAANLGTEFIRMGVRAVVCAGWAVADDAAATFAASFYRAMLTGQTFGQAVLAARKATYAEHSTTNTWGAYQCYGDPGYRLLATSDGRDEPRRDGNFVATAELVAALDSLREGLRRPRDRQAAQSRASLDDRVQELLRAIPSHAQDWLTCGSVCSALAALYSEVDQVDRAIEWWRKAADAETGRCPMYVAEQLPHLEARRAAQRCAAAAADPQVRAAEREKLEQAVQQLAALDHRLRPVERGVLLGGALRRLSRLCDGTEQLAVLDRALAAYRAARRGQTPPAAAAHGGYTPYAITNLSACWLLRELQASKAKAKRTSGGKPGVGAALTRKAITRLCQAAMRQETDAHHRSVDAWRTPSVASLHVVFMLLHARNPGEWRKHAKPAQEQLADWLQRGTTPREVASIRDFLDFVLTFAERAKCNAKLLAALRGLRDML